MGGFSMRGFRADLCTAWPLWDFQSSSCEIGVVEDCGAEDDGVSEVCE